MLAQLAAAESRHRRVSVDESFLIGGWREVGLNGREKHETYGGGSATQLPLCGHLF